MTTWDYMTNMWFNCGGHAPLVDWSFPNGTLVSAQSYEDALYALNQYKLSRNKATVYQTEQGVWTVQYEGNIYVIVKARDRNEAIQRASWKFYLDKREAKDRSVRPCEFYVSP